MKNALLLFIIHPKTKHPSVVANVQVFGVDSFLFMSCCCEKSRYLYGVSHCKRNQYQHYFVLHFWRFPFNIWLLGNYLSRAQNLFGARIEWKKKQQKFNELNWEQLFMKHIHNLYLYIRFYYTTTHSHSVTLSSSPPLALARTRPPRISPTYKSKRNERYDSVQYSETVFQTKPPRNQKQAN